MNLRSRVYSGSLFLSLLILGSCSLVFTAEDDMGEDFSNTADDSVGIIDDSDTTDGDTTIPFTCPDGWTPFPDSQQSPEPHCYREYSAEKNWGNTEIDCNSKEKPNVSKSHLVSINTSEENMFIAEKFIGADAPQNKTIWTGLNKFSNPSGPFSFSNGSTLGFKSWDTRNMADPEPNNNAGEHCVDFRRGGYWHDQNCNFPFFYVCELEPL